MNQKDKFKLDLVTVKLVKDRKLYSEFRMDNPLAVVGVLGDKLMEIDREVMCVINLQSDLKPINVNIVSIGTLNAAMGHPRELLKSSILCNAANIIMVHSHPSGNLLPSKEDTMITDRMNKLCELVGINLVDHLIVGGKNLDFFSFKEKGLIKNPNITYSTDYRTMDFKGTLIAERGGR